MNILDRTLAVILLTTAFASHLANAGVVTTLMREAADQLLAKGGREVAGETAESLTRKLVPVAKKYGEPGVNAVRRGGPTALRCLIEGGEQGPKVVKLFEQYGESAIYIVSRPKSMAIFIQHGDSAAAAMLRHPGIAEDSITPFGTSAARALTALGPQNGRRLAMLADEGLLQQSGRSAEILSTIQRYGDGAMEFIWRHKGSLATGTVLAAFLAHPESFLNETTKLASVALTPAVEKIGEAGVAFTKSMGGTLLAGATAALIIWRWRRQKPRRR